MNLLNKIENIALKVRRSPLLRNLPIWSITRKVYQLILRIITFNRGLSRQLYPDLFFKVSYLSRDSISADFEYLKKWDLPTLNYIKSVIDKSSSPVIFDVGANQGSYSMVCDRWIGGGANELIIAFEPEPKNIQILQENINKNNCTKVKIVSKALGEKQEKLKLFGGSSTTATLIEDYKQNTSDYTLIDVITLDEYCLSENFNPTLIKIDVEGFELAVLKGAKRTLLKNKDTIKIICEIHTFMWKNPDNDLEIINFVSDLGMSIFRLTTASAPGYIPDSSHYGEKVNRIRDYGHYVIAKEFD